MLGLNSLQIDDAGQKRLQNYFDDRRIRFGHNSLRHKDEVWYVPANSRPYKVTDAENVAHAQKILVARSWADKQHARTLLRDIDAHNETLVQKMRLDAMDAVKSDLRAIAAGRQHFMAR